MRSAKSWKILFLLCLVLGMHLPIRAHADVEIKVAEIEEDITQMSLHFPRPFEEEEQLLNNLLYQIATSRIPSEKQETLVFTQSESALYFIGAKHEMSLLQEQIIEIMTSGINEEEFFKEKEIYFSQQAEAEWIQFEDLSKWVELASPIASFAADFYLEAFRGFEQLAFSRIELGGESPLLTFVHDEGTHHFYTLRLTSDDMHNISKLIKNMADKNLWELLKISKDMKKLGKKIDHVHPMRFLGYIFSTHELKKRMPKIKENHFKWNKFTEGLFERLSKEAHQHNLDRFIPGFAQVTKSSESVIQDCVKRHDWASMLDYLMSN